MTWLRGPPGQKSQRDTRGRVKNVLEACGWADSAATAARKEPTPELEDLGARNRIERTIVLSCLDTMLTRTCFCFCLSFWGVVSVSRERVELLYFAFAFWILGGKGWD